MTFNDLSLPPVLPEDAAPLIAKIAGSVLLPRDTGYDHERAVWNLNRKRLGPTVSSIARASGMMVMACRSPCRSREIVSTIGDHGRDPSKSVQIYPVESVGGVRGFSL